MKKILQCKTCKKYTMKEKCDCGGDAVTVYPVKASIPDKYGKYRREAKFKERKKKGLI